MFYDVLFGHKISLFILHVYEYYFALQGGENINYYFFYEEWNVMFCIIRKDITINVLH